MSDLDDLEAFAATHSFGRGENRGYQPRRFTAEYCGQGHLWATSARWFKDGRGRLRRTCRICNRQRQKAKRLKCSAP